MQTLVFKAIDSLTTLKKVLYNLSDQDYNRPSPLLNHSSIGMHVRHLLEFYAQFLKGLKVGHINYDERKREVELQTSITAAAARIEKITEALSSLPQSEDTEVMVASTYGNSTVYKARSSYGRELHMCIEHAVHHEAMMKVAFFEFGLDACFENQFGVAESTLRSKHTSVTLPQ